MATDVKVPALGESITEGTLAQWLKKPGEAVAADEPIASLETDKVSVEVPSPVAGTMSEQLFKEGDTVEVGAVIARIGEAGAAPAPAAEPATGQGQTEVAGAKVNPVGAGENPAPRDDHAAAAEHADLTLSPAVRRAVLELALTYHLVSPYTSLVAVDVTPVRPEDQSLESHALKTNLPDGWDYTAVFGLGQGATDAPVHLMFGLLAGVLAAVLAAAARRASHPRKI